MAVKTFIAGENLTDKIGYAVIASSTNKQVILADDANDICLGILTNDNTSGGAVDFGGELKAADGGALVAAGGTGDDNAIAKALEDGASGDLIYAVVVNFIK